MSSPLVPQLSVRLSSGDGLSGDVIISVSITNNGPAVTAQVIMYVYEGSTFAGHGTLLDQQTETAAFATNETKTFEFPHTITLTTQGRRDIRVQILVAGEEVADEEWDDAFTAESTPSLFENIGDLILLMIVMMMMSMMMEMMSGEGGIFGDERPKKQVYAYEQPRPQAYVEPPQIIEGQYRQLPERTQTKQEND